MPRSLIRYQVAVSIDGLIGPLDGSVDWPAPFESMAAEMLTPFFNQIGGLLMGRVTYQPMRGFRPGPFDAMPAVVLTSDAALETGPSVEVCTSGPRAAIGALAKRAGNGDFWLFGGGRTAASFLDAGLIDQIELTVVPIVLGEGKPLFAGARTAASFELKSSRVGRLGTVSTVYAKRPA